jgi:hypothetical protein
MENSSIISLSFVKFFEGCVISKRMKKAKHWLQFITILLFLLFCGIFTNVTTDLNGKNVSDSIIICMTILYGALITMTIYFKESVISIFLFPNEYFLMKTIKEYLGKIFRDIYLSDINEEKILNHISTLSYYIANLYDMQYIKSQNGIIFANKTSLLACEEFLYFLNVKLNVDKNRDYTLIDLKSNQIANIVYNLFKLEYELSKNKIDDRIFESLNRFLNYEIGKNFVKDYIIYDSSTFDDYYNDECKYNKINLPVINHTPFYRRHIKDRNKQSYNKRNISKAESNQIKKSNLSWIDKI